MKQIIAILIFCLYFISAKSDNILKKKISVKFDNTNLNSALKKIESSADFRFSYNSAIIDKKNHINYECQDEDIKSILKSILTKDISYKQCGNYLILYKVKTVQEVNMFSGKILSSANIPVKSATIYEIGSKNAVLSKEDGKFSIKVKKPGKNIGFLIGKRGFNDTIIYLNKQNKDINITLSELNIDVDPISTIESKQYASLEVEQMQIPNLFIPKERASITRNINITENRKAQISLFPWLGTNYNLSGNISNDISLNIFAGYSKGVNMVELGGFANIVRESVYGVQIAGFGNYVGKNLNGIQIAGYTNYVKESISGIQLAGFVNYSKGLKKYNPDSSKLNLKKLKLGTQIAGGLNIASGNAEGVQIAGIGNYTKYNMHGIQISGVANICRKDVSFNQISGCFNMCRNVKGVQIAGISNYANGDVKGMQISGISNISNGKVTLVKGHGYQITGILNLARNTISAHQIAGISNISYKDIYGLQISGIGNFAHGKTSMPQIGGFINVAKKINTAQVSGFSNTSKKLTGLQVAGFVNSTSDMSGFQVAGFLNIAMNKSEKSYKNRLQIAGYMNFANKDIDAHQIAGFSNISRGNVKGIQLSNYLNYAKNTMAQLSIINVVKDSAYIQIGLINYSRNCKIPIGIFSIVKNGYQSIGVDTDDINNINFTIRSGIPQFYNIVGACINYKDEHMYGLKYGFGNMFTLYKNIKLQTEVVGTIYDLISPDINKTSIIAQFRSGILYNIGNIDFTIAPTYNVHVRDKNVKSLAPYIIESETDKDYISDSWIGLTAGVQFRF